MNAITMLEADHVKVKRLLAELESTTKRGVKTRSELFATIKGELTIHEIIEEESLYPALKTRPPDPPDPVVGSGVRPGLRFQCRRSTG